MNRGDAAAGTWLFRGDGSPPRLGRSAETGADVSPMNRSAAATAAWLFL